MPKRSKRYEFFEGLEVKKDTYLNEMPEIGLLTTGGPEDPRPSKTLSGLHVGEALQEIMAGIE